MYQLRAQVVKHLQKPRKKREKIGKNLYKTLELLFHLESRNTKNTYVSSVTNNTMNILLSSGSINKRFVVLLFHAFLMNDFMNLIQTKLL